MKSIWDNGERLPRALDPTTEHQLQQISKNGGESLSVAHAATNQPQQTSQRDCALILHLAIPLTPIQELEDK